MLSLWGGLLLALAGCSVGAPKPVLVRCIYVEMAVGSPSPELAGFADVIHDNSVRALQGGGFVVAMEPGEADAFLHAAWLGRPSAGGAPAGRVNLRMTLVARDGTVLTAFDAIADAPSGFLTQARVADQVRIKLGAIVR
jgi:hypothetical protein